MSAELCVQGVGFESAFSSLNTIIDLETIQKCLSINPRKRFGVQFDSIKENNKANFSLFSPKDEYIFSEKNILSTSKNSIFLGTKLKGKVYGSFNNNKLTLAQNG